MADPKDKPEITYPPYEPAKEATPKSPQQQEDDHRENPDRTGEEQETTHSPE